MKTESVMRKDLGRSLSGACLGGRRRRRNELWAESGCLCERVLGKGGQQGAGPSSVRWELGRGGAKRGKAGLELGVVLLLIF